MTARALSIQQPWAWAITDLDKLVENRSRPTNFRGEVFLHASAKARPVEDLDDCCTTDEVHQALNAWEQGTMTLGAIVGVAELCYCGTPQEVRGNAELLFYPDEPQDRWIEGPSCYCLVRVLTLPEPVPCKGALGFWKVPPDVEAKVRSQLEMAKKTKARKSETKPPKSETPPPFNDTDRPRPETGEPKANSPEDLGFGPLPPEDYSPAQRTAFREAFRKIAAVEKTRLKRRTELSYAEDDLSTAKDTVKQRQEAVKVCDSDVEELFIHLQTIDSGTWDQKLEFPEGGHASGGAAKLETGGDSVLGPIPDDLMEAAREHIRNCQAKGKGLDVVSVSLALFSSRKAEHKPRCEQIIAALALAGDIDPDESDDSKTRWLPREKPEADA